MRRMFLAIAVAAIAALAHAVPASAETSEESGLSGSSTFTGTCSINGTAYFALPLTLLPVSQGWYFHSNPGTTCTGVYNGDVINAAPIEVTVSGTINGSCGTFTSAVGLKGKAKFPAGHGSRTLHFTLHVASPAFQNALVLVGDKGGGATGRASIVGVEDPAAEVQKCAAGNGSQVFGLAATIVATGLSG